MNEAAPRFFFGAMSPYSWFAAERIELLLPEARWSGVLAGAIFKANDRVSWGLTERRQAGMADCDARAAQHGLGPIRWPEPWPTSDLLNQGHFQERRSECQLLAIRVGAAFDERVLLHLYKLRRFRHRSDSGDVRLMRLRPPSRLAARGKA